MRVRCHARLVATSVGMRHPRPENPKRRHADPMPAHARPSPRAPCAPSGSGEQEGTAAPKPKPRWRSGKRRRFGAQARMEEREATPFRSRSPDGGQGSDAASEPRPGRRTGKRGRGGADRTGHRIGRGHLPRVVRLRDAALNPRRWPDGSLASSATLPTIVGRFPSPIDDPSGGGVHPEPQPSTSAAPQRASCPSGRGAIRGWLQKQQTGCAGPPGEGRKVGRSRRSSRPQRQRHRPPGLPPLQQMHRSPPRAAPTPAERSRS